MQLKTLPIVSLIVTFLLTGCTQNEVSLNESPSPISFLEETSEILNVLEDGIYFAKEDTFDEDGWKNILSFEVYNSKITTVSFDAINESAATTKKEISLAGIYTLGTENTQSALRWDEQIEILQNYILNNQNFDSFYNFEEESTIISDLTIDIQPYMELFYLAVDNGPIESGPYIDGFYFAQQEEFENSFKYFIRLIVKNGHIIAVHWNGINEDGVRLLSDFSLEDTENTWREQARRLEKFLVDVQDPTIMTFDSDNKTEDIFGVSIEVNAFIELAVQALAAGPLIIEEN